MKRTVLFVAFLATATIVAQNDKTDKLIIEKGTWNLDGSFSVGINDFENTFQNEAQNDRREFESSSFSIAPQIGYAIKKNLIVGVGVGYGRFKTASLSLTDSEVNQDSETTGRSLSLFPFVRLFFPVGEKLAFSAQGEIRYSNDMSEFTDQIMNLTFSETNVDSIFIGFRPGITYFISNHFALESRLGSLGYSKSESETDGESGRLNGFSGESESFSFNLNSADLFFGLSYYF